MFALATASAASPRLLAYVPVVVAPIFFLAAWRTPLASRRFAFSLDAYLLASFPVASNSEVARWLGAWIFVAAWASLVLIRVAGLAKRFLPRRAPATAPLDEATKSLGAFFWVAPLFLAAAVLSAPSFART